MGRATRLAQAARRGQATALVNGRLWLCQGRSAGERAAARAPRGEQTCGSAPAAVALRVARGRWRAMHQEQQAEVARVGWEGHECRPAGLLAAWRDCLERAATAADSERKRGLQRRKQYRKRIDAPTAWPCAAPAAAGPRRPRVCQARSGAPGCARSCASVGVTLSSDDVVGSEQVPALTDSTRAGAAPGLRRSAPRGRARSLTARALRARRLSAQWPLETTVRPLWPAFARCDYKARPRNA